MQDFNFLDFKFPKIYKPTLLLWIGVVGIIFHLILHWSSPSTLVVMQITNIVIAIAYTTSFFFIAYILSRKPTRAQWFFIPILSMSALWWTTCLVPVLLGYGQHTISDISNVAYNGVEGIDGITGIVNFVRTLRKAE